MEQAMSLATFLADLEPVKSPIADIILVKRFDCPEPSSKDIEKICRKFHVWTYKSPKREVGWPDGCNGLWFATMEWVYSMIADRRCPHYKAIFTFEADGGPLAKDWIARLSQEWDRVNSIKPVCMAGPLVSWPAEHINGNALISGDLGVLKWITRTLNGSIRGGWDYVLAPEFRKRGWANIPGMRSYYNSATFTQEQYAQMVLDDLIWVHGDKSGCLRDWARNPVIGLKAPTELRKKFAADLVSSFI
jgi:hypothetical protein